MHGRPTGFVGHSARSVVSIISNLSASVTTAVSVTAAYLESTATSVTSISAGYFFSPHDQAEFPYKMTLSIPDVLTFSPGTSQTVAVLPSLSRVVTAVPEAVVTKIDKSWTGSLSFSAAGQTFTVFSSVTVGAYGGQSSKVYYVGGLGSMRRTFTWSDAVTVTAVASSDYTSPTSLTVHSELWLTVYN